MTKRILIILGILILLIICIEVFNLLQLKANVDRYAMYWHNKSSESGEFTYVALGDSAAQGLGASKPEKGYVGQLAEHIETTTHKKVRIINLSVTGAKIEDVIHTQLPQLNKYMPDLVTMEIGANDVAGTFNADKFREQYDALATQLPKGTIVGNMPYFGGRIRHNTQALSASEIIAQLAAKHDLVLADLQTTTRINDSVLGYASDYFHPNDRGYRNWEAAFWEARQSHLNERP